ncbi:hypothetical protein OS493_022030 [Desmophyllum pertusum]|uniref:Uncharacterized protein n=1 Tax=Desmophyllum pertusum TaxID=174260 RepID=A0A9W9YYU8_9CNID|nr:hypothetical protein OS493_022030 [Desmophyllum pertusum]
MNVPRSPEADVTHPGIFYGESRKPDFDSSSSDRHHGRRSKQHSEGLMAQPRIEMRLTFMEEQRRERSQLDETAFQGLLNRPAPRDPIQIYHSRRQHFPSIPDCDKPTKAFEIRSEKKATRTLGKWQGNRTGWLYRQKPSKIDIPHLPQKFCQDWWKTYEEKEERRKDSTGLDERWSYQNPRKERDLRGRDV